MRQTRRPELQCARRLETRKSKKHVSISCGVLYEATATYTWIGDWEVGVSRLLRCPRQHAYGRAAKYKCLKGIDIPNEIYENVVSGMGNRRNHKVQTQSYNVNLAMLWVRNTGYCIPIPPAHTRGRLNLWLNLWVRHSANCNSIFHPHMLEGHARKSERALPEWHVNYDFQGSSSGSFCRGRFHVFMRYGMTGKYFNRRDLHYLFKHGFRILSHKSFIPDVAAFYTSLCST